MKQPAPRTAIVSSVRGNPGGGAPHWVHFWGDALPCAPAKVADLLGGKAASLGMLSRAGLPVPPAFTLSAESCRLYHAHARQLPDGLWQEALSAVARLESVTGRTFGSEPLPLTLAVRSGAAAAMPGLLTTLLHCGLCEPVVRRIDDGTTWGAFAEFLDVYAPLRLRGQKRSGIRENSDAFDSKSEFSRAPLRDAEVPPPPLDGSPARSRCEHWLARLAKSPRGPLPEDPLALLREAIMAVFDSWEFAEARRFREHVGWTAAEGTAVTVQVMFNSEVAGVVFSRGPAPSVGDDMVVEAVAGLGRPLVGGRVTPLRWTLDRVSHRVKSCSGARESSDLASVGSEFSRIQPDPMPGGAIARFSESGLQAVCRAAVRMESVFQGPCDVEFGYAAGEIAFFQARPITQSTAFPVRERFRMRQRDRLLAWARQGRRLWVRHNLAQTLPAPTPLTWDLWRAFMSGEGGFGSLVRRLGYRPSARVRRDGFLELIAGRIYADPERLRELICAGYPLSFDVVAMRKDSGVLDRAPTRLDIECLDPWFLLRWPLVALTMVRAAMRIRRLARRAAANFDQTIVPWVRELVERERRVDLGQMSPAELIEVFDRRRKLVFDSVAPHTLLPGTLGAAAWAALERRLLSVLGETDGRAVADELLSRTAASTTDPQSESLRRLASGDMTFEAFFEEFGHRGPDEMDLSSPRWRERPQDVWTAARRPAPTRSEKTVDSQHASPEARLRAALEQAGAGCLVSESVELLQQSATLLACREKGKHELLRAYELLRDVLTELSRRTGLGDGVHFLTVAELTGLPGARDVERVIAERRDEHSACRMLDVPAVLEVGDDLAGFGMPLPEPSRGRTVPGTPLSRGQGAGRVFLLAGSERAFEPPLGSVVVASTLDPAWVPFLTGAAAFVVELGGTLSHVAILARQLSIPAVVVERITHMVADGDDIRVDADRGLIELVDRPL